MAVPTCCTIDISPASKPAKKEKETESAKFINGSQEGMGTVHATFLKPREKNVSKGKKHTGGAQHQHATAACHTSTQIGTHLSAM